MSNKSKVLVIGMDEKTLSVIRESLSDCDVTDMDIDEGKDTLNIPDQDRPDLIILNARSEKQMTLELCKGLKTNSSTADVPLLVTFDRNQVTQIQYALEVGAKKCMVKPLIPSYVKETVEDLLGTK